MQKKFKLIKKIDLSLTNEKRNDLILKFCENKYNEEIQRENGINTKAGFLLTIISLLIVGYTSLLTLFNSIYIDCISCINFLMYVFIGLLFIDLFILLFGINFTTRNYLSKINTLVDFSKNKKYKDEITDGIIDLYSKTLESFSNCNSKRIKVLTASIIILLVIIALTIISSIFIFGGIIY